MDRILDNAWNTEIKRRGEEVGSELNTEQLLVMQVWDMLIYESKRVIAVYWDRQKECDEALIVELF